MKQRFSFLIALTVLLSSPEGRGMMSGHDEPAWAQAARATLAKEQQERTRVFAEAEPHTDRWRWSDATTLSPFWHLTHELEEKKGELAALQAQEGDEATLKAMEASIEALEQKIAAESEEYAKADEEARQAFSKEKEIMAPLNENLFLRTTPEREMALNALLRGKPQATEEEWQAIQKGILDQEKEVLEGKGLDMPEETP